MIDVLQRDWLYAHPETLVSFIGNHDTSRSTGEPDSSKEKLKAAFSLLLTLRGIRQIYCGDEIGMRGGNDPDSRRDFPGGFPVIHTMLSPREVVPRISRRFSLTCKRCCD
jgi:glycosidase